MLQILSPELVGIIYCNHYSRYPGTIKGGNIVLRRIKANGANEDFQTNLCIGEVSSHCDPDQRALVDSHLAQAIEIPLEKLHRRNFSSPFRIGQGNSGRRDFMLTSTVTKRDSGQGRVQNICVIEFG